VSAEEFILGRDGQAQRQGLAIGIVAMSPDPADSAARLAVRVTGRDEGVVQTVHAGDVLHAGGKVVRVTSVKIGPRGNVGLSIDDE
jgi:hypothetical protein